MGAIFLAIPIAIFIIFAIFVFVKFSDSNKHLEKMDTNSRLELEKIRDNIIKKIKDKKSQILVSNDVTNKSLIKNLQKEKETNKLQNIISNIQENEKSKIKKETNTSLSFTKENLIRGIIATEYLYRKKR